MASSMAALTNRRPDPEARRGAILDAAQALFATKGWEAVTVADVLAAAGLSKGGFYHHFAAKEDVLEALVARMTRQALRTAEAARDAARGGALARLNAFVSGSVRWKAANAAQLRAAVEVMARPGNAVLVARLRAATETAVRPALRAMIEEGVADGAFDVPDPDVAAELILALGEGRRAAVAAAMDATASGDVEAAAGRLMERMRAEARACDRLLGLPEGSVVLAERPEIEAMLAGMAAGDAARRRRRRMMRIEEIAPRVHEITLEGVVEKADVEALERAIAPLLEGEGKVSLVIRAEAWSDITADALAEDIRFELGLLPKLRKVARVAVVTPKQGLAALVRWIDPVVPMVGLRAFGAEEVEAARDWAGAASVSGAGPAGPGITILEDGTSGVLAYEIDGRMTREGVAAVFDALRRATAGDRKVDLMLVVRDWDGFQLSILDRELMGDKFAAIGRVRRYAVVGAPAWMAMAAGAMDPVLPIDIRTFDLAARDEAREWLST